MQNIGTLSCTMLWLKLLDKTKILPTKLSFEVKIKDIAQVCELKTRFCANKSRKLEGINF